MRFTPNYQLKIIPEEQFSSAILKLEDKLSSYMHSGSLNAFDGCRLHYEYFLCENARASVVIVHGLSEFTKKFYEFTYYLLNQGYNVFIYDQRCHGLSSRLTDNITLLHVDRFSDYVADLNQFINEIVIPASDGADLYIYSHSMGGVIASLYLAKYPEKIKKAVLSAPMFEPIVASVPTNIARWGVRVGKTFCGGKKKFPLSSEFNPDVTYKKTYDASRARFEHNLKMRRENPMYQTTPMSFGWVIGSLTVRKAALSGKTISRIKTPILLLSAELDRVVNNEPQLLFARRCQTCNFVSIKGANHALLTSDFDTMTEVLTRIFDFFAA